MLETESRQTLWNFIRRFAMMTESKLREEIDALLNTGNGQPIQMPTMVNETRQYELDIDLKILRAARKGEVLSYTFFQHMREQVLGFKLNIRCLYNPHPTVTV